MGFFLSLFFTMFLIALVVLLYVAFKVWRFYRKVKRVTGYASEKKERGRKKGHRGQARRGRIIPPEYAVDVEYEVVARSGNEQFVIIQEVLSYRGESQISDATYTVIIS